MTVFTCLPYNPSLLYRSLWRSRLRRDQFSYLKQCSSSSNTSQQRRCLTFCDLFSSLRPYTSYGQQRLLSQSYVIRDSRFPISTAFAWLSRLACIWVCRFGQWCQSREFSLRTRGEQRKEIFAANESRGCSTRESSR